MKMIGRRLSKLEAALLPQKDTWQMELLRDRMEAGRKRVAAIRGERALARSIESYRRLSITDRLQAGRMMAHQQWLTVNPALRIATDNSS